MTKEIDIKCEIYKIGQRISIGLSPSNTIASYVIIYKTLNINKDLALMCMKELAYRRNLGENFEYEKFIEEEISKIPKMQGINLPELSKTILNNKNYKSILKGK
ncbi:MAG: hypothetical protein Q8P20_00415 [bacterium]|nr:hypothetical protein [bacterium]